MQHGERISTRRLRPLMQDSSLRDVSITKVGYRHRRISDDAVPNLVLHRFTVPQPNAIWVTDLTEIRAPLRKSPHLLQSLMRIRSRDATTTN